MRSALVTSVRPGRLLLPLTVAVLLGQSGAGMAHRQLDWYDEQKQQLKSPALQPLEDPTAPQKWVWKSQPSKNQNRSWRFPELGDLAAQILEIVSWVSLGIGFLWLLVYVLRFIQNQESQGMAEIPRPAHQRDAIQMQKLAELPFNTASSPGNLLDAAKEMYEQGNYDRAILFLFGYQLLLLDQHQRILLRKGKTNRQYLREIKHDAWLSALLAETMEAFEGSYFGNHAVRREQFESCWERMERFHRQLEMSA